MNSLNEIFSAGGVPMGPHAWSQLLFSLILAGVLSGLVAYFYKRFGNTAATPTDLESTLIILSLSIALIMQIVGNSVARAFSLAGALSIIRFRNAIRETDDIAAIFLVMGVGLGCGSGFFSITAIGTVFILLTWTFLKKRQKSRQTNPIFHLLSVNAQSAQALEAAFREIQFEKICRNWVLLQTKMDLTDQSPTYVYRLNLNQSVSPEEELLKPLLKSEGINKAAVSYSQF